MNDIKLIEKILSEWKKTRLEKIEIAGLYSRNPVAHKWKAPFRALVIRELVYWRLIDLIDQALELNKINAVLGARILLRSAFETVAILIFLNSKIESLINGNMQFKDFENTTLRLLLGSRRDEQEIKSYNIISILEGCEKHYPGITKVYNDLSETAHPNYDGMIQGYSEFDKEKHVTFFHSRWDEIYGEDFENLMMICIKTFESEYNDVWSEHFERLEKWLEENDENLEAQRSSNT